MKESKGPIPEESKPEPMSLTINPVKIPEGAKKIHNYILGMYYFQFRKNNWNWNVW